MAFGLPNVNEIKKEFNDKFDKLIAKLDEILVELKKKT